MEFTVDVFNSTDHSLQAFLRAEDAAGQPYSHAPGRA